MLKPTEKDWAIVNHVSTAAGDDLYGMLIRNREGVGVIVSMHTVQMLTQMGIVEQLPMRELNHLTVPEGFEEDLSPLGLDTNTIPLQYHRSYKEIKNFIHNEEGVSKVEIEDTLYGMAQMEVKKLLDENHHAISQIIYGQVKKAMVEAIASDRVSSLYGRSYLKDKEFKQFMQDAMKDAVADILKEQFSVSVNIEQHRVPDPASDDLGDLIKHYNSQTPLPPRTSATRSVRDIVKEL